MKMLKAIYTVFLGLALAVCVSLLIGSSDHWGDLDG